MRKQINLSKLLRILEKNGLHPTWSPEEGSVKIGLREFVLAPFQPNLMELPDDQGLLLSHSTKEQRKILRDRHISYVDPNGYVHIDLDSSKRMIIEDHFNRRKNKSKKSVSQESITPTLLVSPNGFAFIDALLRTSPEETRTIHSTLEFCRLNNLYQPKASRIMTGLHAKDLLDLRKKIIEVPIEWWLFAFDTPTTKRKMTAFFDIVQRYYTLDTQAEEMTEDELLRQINDEFKDGVTGGPTLMAKRLGTLVDSNLTLWVSSSDISRFRSRYKLVAGSKLGQRSWMIASPAMDLRKAELISHKSDNSTPLASKTNIMRAIWDLSFSESRLREIREQLLRSFWKNEI